MSCAAAIPRRARALAALAVLVPVAPALLVPAALAAQVPDSAVDRPFVRGGIYDKPYLGSIAGRAAIGGYAEAHAVWLREDGVTGEAGFIAKRFNLFTAARVSDIVRFGAELEFEEGGEEVKLEFAAIDLLLHPAVALRAGMILSPLGRFNLAHDSPLNPFTDRPFVSTELLGVALSEPGLGVFGLVPLGAGRVSYEVYGVNGFHSGLIDDAEEGTRLPLGRGNFEDNNASPALVGRLAYSPSTAAEVGFSAHHGAYNVFDDEGLAIDERRDVTVFVGDFEIAVAGFTLTAEAATVDVDIPPGLVGIFASGQRGVFADLVRPFGRGWFRTLPASYLAAAARVDAVDFDTDRPGDSTWRVTAGLNFHPTPESAVKLDLVRGGTRDRFENRGDHAGVQFSLATYF
ncbi:MAG TPA: hypothetical protein VML95_03275 [Longimicrobiales bacterium]|nr:hypothetical protein [Longimicrobiales bacterium]